LEGIYYKIQFGTLFKGYELVILELLQFESFLKFWRNSSARRSKTL